MKPKKQDIELILEQKLISLIGIIEGLKAELKERDSLLEVIKSYMGSDNFREMFYLLKEKGEEKWMFKEN